MSEPAVQSNKLVGIDVKHSGAIAVCLDDNQTVVDSYKTDFHSGEESTLHLGGFINELKTKFGDFDKVGLTVPGLLNKRTGRIAYSAHIPQHSKIDLLGELRKSTAVNVHIENDANAAAYGEYVLGAGRGNQDMFYITLGSGVGGALIFDDKIWHGASGFAGEFGYVVVNAEGVKLEDVASSENILRRTRERFHQDTTSSLNEIGEENITIADVVREARQGDDFAQLMLERTGNFVGVALAGVINLLNIEKVVVSGEILNAKEIVLDAMIQRAEELSFLPSFRTVEIVEGSLGENASAIGVALLSDFSNKA